MILPNYGSVVEGDSYFMQRLDSASWEDAEYLDKTKALIEATRLIDRLNFKGCKAEPDQTTQFPRGTDTVVPQEIEIATYEQAIQLLDGVNPDFEHEDLRTTEDRYASVRVVKTTEWIQDYTNSGITSSRAWHLIKPFLRSTNHLKIRRDS